MLIDSHCHLDVFQENLSEILTRAKEAGITKFVTIGAGTDKQASQKAHDIAKQYKNIWFACGIHPHDASKASDAAIQFHEQLLHTPKAVALGEIGLDYHYNFSEPKTQQDLFIQQLEQAKALKKPIVVHLREAFDDGLSILDEYYQAQAGVIHCFTGTYAEGKAFIDRGYYLSIPGVVTFKKAHELQDAVKRFPLDRMLCETDSPYLAPVPKRGKTNEPAYLAHTARFMAKLLDISYDKLAKQTSDNCEQLFKLEQ